MLFKRNISYFLRPKFFHSTVYISYREDYIRLGISEKATKEEIKAAYYEKAKLLHPDATEQCKIVEEEFFELNEAYKRLIYESKYDSGSYDKRGRFYQYFLVPYTSLEITFLDQSVRLYAPTPSPPLSQHSVNPYHSLYSRDLRSLHPQPLKPFMVY